MIAQSLKKVSKDTFLQDSFPSQKGILDTEKVLSIMSESIHSFLEAT